MWNRTTHYVYTYLIPCYCYGMGALRLQQHHDTVIHGITPLDHLSDASWPSPVGWANIWQSNPMHRKWHTEHTWSGTNHCIYTQVCNTYLTMDLIRIWQDYYSTKTPPYICPYILISMGCQLKSSWIGGDWVVYRGSLQRYEKRIGHSTFMNIIQYHWPLCPGGTRR